MSKYKGFEHLDDRDLAAVARNIIKSKEKNIKSEYLATFAEKLFQDLNTENEPPTTTLRECIDICFDDLSLEIMKRFVNDHY